jgi:hypothetical protein
LLREHEASVSRHLSAARKAIRRGVEHRLKVAGLSPAETALCFESVAEDAGTLDLERVLEGARNPDAGVQSKESAASRGKAMLLANVIRRVKR